MKIITYDKFKTKLIRNLGAVTNFDISIYAKISPFDALAISANNGEDWQSNLVTMREGVATIIKSWDIRMVNKLFELFPDEIFPSIIPKKYKNKQPRLDYNEKGEWCIILNIYA